MSAIASFYLLRNEHVDRLKDLAAGDPFWEFLSTQARALEPFEWSGYVMGSEVYFYLESRGAALEDYCDEPLTEHLSESLESTVFAFHADGAGDLAQLIQTYWPDEANLHAFLHSPDMMRPDGDVAPVEAVFDGLRLLKTWLAQVDEGHVGLLTIG